MLKKIKWICGIVSIVTSIYVGLFFYSGYMQDKSVYYLLVLENTLKCFLASPNLKLSEVADAIFVQKKFNSTFVFYMYALSVYLAPVCVGAIILDTFSSIRYALLSFVFNIKAFFSSNIVIIFGYNDMVRKLVLNENKEKNEHVFYVFTIKNLNIDEKIDFINKNIYIFNFDKFYKNFNFLATKMFLKLLNRAYLMLLMNEDATINFSRLIKIDSFTKENAAKIIGTINVYCYVEDYHSKLMINEYIDKINKERKDKKLEVKCNYETFDISQLRTRELLKDKNNYVVKDLSKTNTHSVIIGFGRLGHAVFDEVLNESVYNQNGKIDIDIIGNDIDIEKNYILNKISTEYVEKITDDHYKLDNSNDKSDGELNIYFHSIDINDKAFSDKLVEINQRNGVDNYIDNIYVCPKKANICIRTLNVINNLIREDSFGKNSSNILIYTRFENENIMVDFIENSKDVMFKNVKYFKPIDDVLKINIIKDEANIKRAFSFNFIYKKLGVVIENQLKNNHISFKEIFDWKLESEEESEAYDIWKNDKYINKASTWHLSLHTKIKEYILDELYDKNKVLNQLKDILTMQFDGIESFVNYIKNNNSKEIIEYIKLEHRRWNYNKAFNGFKYSVNKDADKHRHDCLLTFDKLCEKKPDTIIYDLIPLIYILINNKRVNSA